MSIPAVFHPYLFENRDSEIAMNTSLLSLYNDMVQNQWWTIPLYENKGGILSISARRAQARHGDGRARVAFEMRDKKVVNPPARQGGRDNLTSTICSY